MEKHFFYLFNQRIIVKRQVIKSFCHKKDMLLNLLINIIICNIY
uniref:Uncharacterized protein n=1 Tax=viral metagenome TaxID=1070528 RepID=A0A6C0H6H0_9ZZZZ